LYDFPYFEKFSESGLYWLTLFVFVATNTQMLCGNLPQSSFTQRLALRVKLLLLEVPAFEQFYSKCQPLSKSSFTRSASR
jgi:hypothetical protein